MCNSDSVESFHRVFTVLTLMQMLNTIRGFPGGTDDKEPACQRRRRKRCGLDPWIRKIPCGRKWQPTPGFLPGESHGQRSLVSYSPCGPKELDTVKRLSTHKHDPGAMPTEGKCSNIPWISDDFTTDPTKSEGPPVSWVKHQAEAPNAKFSWALISNRHSPNSLLSREPWSGRLSTHFIHFFVCEICSVWRSWKEF